MVSMEARGSWLTALEDIQGLHQGATLRVGVVLPVGMRGAGKVMVFLESCG